MLKKYLFCIVLVCLAVLSNVDNILAQEFTQEHYKTKINPITPKSGITSGYVVFNGHFIKPPYNVTSNDKCVKINNIVVYGSEKPIKSKKKSEAQLLEEKNYHEARNAYLKLLKLNNKDTMAAIDSALQILRKIKRYGPVYYDTTERIVIITKYYKGKPEKEYLETFLDPEYTSDPLSSKREVTKTPAESMAKQAKYYSDDLTKDRALYFFTGHYMALSRSHNSIKEIKDILLNKNISNSSKYNKLGEILYDFDDVYYIIYNFNEKDWRLNEDRIK